MAEQEKEIDLLEIIKVLKKHYIPCILAAVLAGIAAFFITSFAVDKHYTSSVTMYVNSNASSTNVNLSDINASQKLADTYIIILENGGIYEDLTDELEEQFTADELRRMISLSVVENTEVVKITSEAKDPLVAHRICEEFAALAPDELEKVVLGGVVRVIGEPSVNTEPISPNVMRTTAVAAFAAGVLTALVYIAASMLDVRIRDEKDVTARHDVAVLGVVPEQNAVYEQIGKKTSGSASGKRLKNSNNRSALVITESTPFSISEAYNKICANIRFSVSQDKHRIIVVTSSIPGEFKSTTSTNLAISIAQSGARVLLVDSDMRKPTLHNCVRVPNENGLSNVLAGFCDAEDVLYEEIRPNMDFISSGLIPPNPVTLLSSERAKRLFAAFGADYDYVIIDSPPLNLVSDAALLSEYATGVLMVVREGKCTKTSVDAAMESLNIAKANLLGVVMTGSDASQNPYGAYGYSYSYSYSERIQSGLTTDMKR